MLVLLGVFYIWRRIYGLESYSKILEKKISNLKKENKELQELLNGSDKTTFEDADIIMNKIFNVNACDIINDKCCVGDNEVCFTKNIPTSVKISVSSDTSEVDDKDDTEITIQNIIGLNDDSTNVSAKLPVAEHNDTIEIESVVSETNGMYNRKKLSKMNLDKLREICSSMNLSSEGTKNNLIDRILA